MAQLASIGPAYGTTAKEYWTNWPMRINLSLHTGFRRQELAVPPFDWSLRSILSSVCAPDPNPSRLVGRRASRGGRQVAAGEGGHRQWTGPAGGGLGPAVIRTLIT